MLNITTLGSGSSGNSALVCSGKTRLLVDAGLSAKQLKLRLEAIGVDPASLDGILLTHEHGDHMRGIDVFCRKLEVPCLLYGADAGGVAGYDEVGGGMEGDPDWVASLRSVSLGCGVFRWRMTRSIRSGS